MPGSDVSSETTSTANYCPPRLLPGSSRGVGDSGATATGAENTPEMLGSTCLPLLTPWKGSGSSWWLSDDVTAVVSSKEECFVFHTSRFLCWRQFFPAWHRLAELVFWRCVPQQRAQHGRATRATTTSSCHTALLSSLLLLGSLWALHRTQGPFPAPAGQVWTRCGSCCNPTSHQAEFSARFPSLLSRQKVGEAGACLSSRQTLSCLD